MYYQVTEYYDPIGQREISSKCPDCGNRNCLELHFYQKRIETGFSKKISKKVTGVLVCNHTQTEISPVLWTEEIEKYFNTEKTRQNLNPTGLKVKKWFYFILIVPTLIILTGIGYFTWEENNYNDQSTALKNVVVGDKVKVMQSLIRNKNVTEHGNTWYQITSITADTVLLKQHKNFNNEDEFNFDLSNDNFTGETIKASLKNLKERSVMGFDYTNMKFSGYITEIKKEE